MSWWIYPAHFVAHLQPSLDAGTADSYYPVSNIRTTDFNVRAKISTGVSGIQLTWDRGNTAVGTGTRQAIDTILILNNNMAGSTWTLRASDDSTFSTFDALVTGSTNIQRDIFVRFTASTRRYVRWFYSNTTGGPYSFGLISVGPSYQMATAGPQIGNETLVAENVGKDGRIRWTRSFRTLTRANAELVEQLAAKYYIYDSGNVLIDGFGGAGGIRPIALIDDGPNPDVIHYGPATVTVQPWQPNYSEIFVTMNEWREGLNL